MNQLWCKGERAVVAHIVHWTAGHQAERLILHLGHDSYQNSFNSLGYPRPNKKKSHTVEYWPKTPFVYVIYKLTVLMLPDADKIGKYECVLRLNGQGRMFAQNAYVKGMYER